MISLKVGTLSKLTLSDSFHFIKILPQSFESFKTFKILEYFRQTTESSTKFTRFLQHRDSK